MELPLAGGGGISPSGRRLGAVGPPARPAGAQQPARPRTAPPRDISALGGMLENLDNDSTFGGGAYFRFLETEAGGSRGVPTAPLGAGQQPSCGITAAGRKPPPRPQTASGWSMGAADPTLSALSLASTQDFAQQISQQTEGILRGTVARDRLRR